MIIIRPGQTKTVKFGRLTHIREGLITADADITCTIHNAAHVVVDTLTGTADGVTGDWYADFNGPADDGVYHIKAVCLADSAREERELVFEVKAIA